MKAVNHDSKGATGVGCIQDEKMEQKIGNRDKVLY